METIGVQVPASLYASIYRRYGEGTTNAITAKLSDLIDDETAVAGPRVSSGKGQYPRPSSGTITGRVWDIADQVQRQSGNAEREAVIKACMEEGINLNTASTQFSYWKKANR